MYSWSVKVHRKVCHVTRSGRRARPHAECPPQTTVHRDVRHRWCAAGAAKSELTSCDAWPAAGHAHSAAVLFTPLQHPAAGTLWHTRSTGGCARPTQRTPDSTRWEINTFGYLLFGHKCTGCGKIKDPTTKLHYLKRRKNFKWNFFRLLRT